MLQMTEKILLSFVVPVYNVEKYLNECLDSIFDPSVDEDEYEVIAVNDGSTDNSPEILRAYERHKNFRIITQKNAGLGFARNAGMREANGRYISFVDSDDFLLPGAVPVLIDLARETDCDIAEFDFERCYDVPDENMPHVTAIKSPRQTESGKKYFVEKRAQGNYEASAWNKICRKEFLDANLLGFTGLRLSEDAEWESRCYFYAEKVAYYPVLLYGYRQRQGSITRSAGSAKQCYAMIELVDALDGFRKNIDSNEGNADFRAALGGQIAFFMDTAINLMYKYCVGTDRAKVFAELKKRRALLGLAVRKKGRRMYQSTRWLPARVAFKMYKIL